MKSYINTEFNSNLEIIKDCYYNNVLNENSEHFSLITSPFKVLKLKNVISDIKHRNDLFQAVKSLKLNRLDNDLYSLWQSDDLNYVELKPIKRFINTLKNEIAPVLSKVCSVELNNKITATASLYKQGDVLLCHDDKCDDRCIAFVYYLTGRDDSGGSFDMFDHDDNNQPKDVVHSLPPEENTFIFFEVGNLTYHQVSEITGATFERYSINGWFHSNRRLPPLEYEELPCLTYRQISLTSPENVGEFISPLYCSQDMIENMRQSFEDESFILLKDIFKSGLYKQWLTDLTSSEIIWQKKGPPNRRYYYYQSLASTLPKSFSHFMNTLLSPLFVSYLKSITGTDIEPAKGDKIGSEIAMELIKWSPGCYTMATDNEGFFKKPGLDLFIFFCSPNSADEDSSGDIIYLDTTDSDDEDSIVGDEEDKDSRHLITITPNENTLVLVYRDTGTARFTKYLNHQSAKEYYAIYATYYDDTMAADLDSSSSS